VEHMNIEGTWASATPVIATENEVNDEGTAETTMARSVRFCRPQKCGEAKVKEF